MIVHGLRPALYISHSSKTLRACFIFLTRTKTSWVKNHLHVRKSVPVSGRHHASLSRTVSNGSKSSRVKSESRNRKPGSWSSVREGKRGGGGGGAETKGPGGGGGAENGWVTVGLDNCCASASCRRNGSSSPHRGRSVTLLRLSAGYRLLSKRIGILLGSRRKPDLSFGCQSERATCVRPGRRTESSHTELRRSLDQPAL